MKAAYIEHVGGSENILIGDLPLPMLAPSEVLVKVIYTTVNHVDCYIRSGKYPQPLPKPFIIGRDLCGEVVQIGERVTDFKPGDYVWSNCQGIHGRQGTFAEYVAASEDTLFHLPRNVDPLTAIIVLHSFFTALLGLEREAKLKKNETIYIQGAAGSIGAAVTQVAKSFGARVITSTSGQEKMNYCYQLGADEVLDYREDLKAILMQLAPQGIDVFWNTSRIHDFKQSLPLLAHKGRYILMAGAGMEAILPIGELYTRDASIRGFAITNATLDEMKLTAPKINTLLEQTSPHKIAKTLTLKEARQAHEMMETDELWGKIVIKIG
ncbi:Quinone oxidoreductase (NADPH:quinone reductase) [Legionella lansingensis]|uniref:Quinone oxidoreductase (NADPH:quinone reductase) n=1 Tax=Legionella lansingensis TaxID=45067 RepID=A0A0W0VG94_9GAMM|nr:NADPH:quinone reductase [Legionella lansingensis]KTD19152.1 Quinone oxidoreductase (NADPH:quinone reductase) [Legionella lansingensis]SNV45446.1 Quinone oxidoreductase (NADPH:quinone reductase) [Legionella lansingensis]